MSCSTLRVKLHVKSPPQPLPVAQGQDQPDDIHRGGDGPTSEIKTAEVQQQQQTQGVEENRTEPLGTAEPPPVAVNTTTILLSSSSASSSSSVTVNDAFGFDAGDCLDTGTRTTRASAAAAAKAAVLPTKRSASALEDEDAELIPAGSGGGLHLPSAEKFSSSGRRIKTTSKAQELYAFADSANGANEDGFGGLIMATAMPPPPPAAAPARRPPRGSHGGAHHLGSSSASSSREAPTTTAQTDEPTEELPNGSVVHTNVAPAPVYDPNWILPTMTTWDFSLYKLRQKLLDEQLSGQVKHFQRLKEQVQSIKLAIPGKPPIIGLPALPRFFPPPSPIPRPPVDLATTLAALSSLSSSSSSSSSAQGESSGSGEHSEFKTPSSVRFMGLSTTAPSSDKPTL